MRAALYWAFMALLLLSVWATALLKGARRDGPTFDEDKFFRLEVDIDKFGRLYQGCPATGFPPEVQCVRGESVFDARLWRKIADEGRSMFGHD